ncbi:hypothetical protein PBRA_009447 [Plasmodiophora brassicae]|uniref:Cilia- and flagella-associated protein 58 central coiled coil domain-containing protein n=1 Tax=Plasmodiophora brassicae TaxID=37360 RepID=A0A0G4J7P7_PLABS|nr:hypothetical protein PBRA_009447 [Plasmodiophora brassicae]
MQQFDDPTALEASLLEAVDDPTGGELAPFLAEYAKMQQALRKSHESEMRFVNKCRELAQALQDVNERTAEMDVEEQDGRKKMEILTKQADMADDARATLTREIDERRLVIGDLRGKLGALRAKMETWEQVLMEDQQRAIGALEQELSVVVAARDKGLRHLTHVRSDNAALFARVDQLEADKQKQVDDIADLSARAADIESACKDELARKADLEAKTAELKDLCEQHSQDISRKVERARKAKQELAKEKAQLKESMKSGATASTRLTQLNEEAQDLEDQLQAQQDATDDVGKGIAALQAASEADRARIDQRKMELRVAQQAAAVALRAIDVASREREILNHDHAGLVDDIAAKRNALHVYENQTRNMENELKAFDASIKAWKALIDQLVQDKDAFRNELEAKQGRIRKATERSLAKDLQILALQKTIVEHEARRRQQMTLLEAVKTDRNLYSKTLLEQKHEMGDLKRVYDGLNHAIAHLQQELNEKETAFVNENLLVEQVDDDIRQTDLKTKQVGQWWQATHERVREQAAQIAQLSRVIDDADEELLAQTKQYNAVVNEERALSRQLLDSINTDRGEVLRLRAAIVQMDKALVEEQLRARVLDGELRRPMNIHRWRQMQDTNADTYALVESIQGLQKDIIAKSDELADKNARIAQKERLYVDLRRILSSQLGEEAHEQLRLFDQTIKEKRALHRTMKAELKMYQAKVYELRYEIEKTYKQLDLVKLSFFQRMRADGRGRSRGYHLTGDDSSRAASSVDGAASRVVHLPERKSRTPAAAAASPGDKERDDDDDEEEDGAAFDKADEDALAEATTAT